MGDGELLVLASGLVVARGGRRLLDAVDIEVRRGEIVSLIGPNGAGKTTLARALLGIVPPDEGRVTQRVDLRIGYVPQRLHLDRTLPLTVSGFLALGGVGDAAPLLVEAGAPGLARRQVSALSGGELQRVLLARAMARQPELLVLDEPVQGVDVAGQIALYALIGDIRDRLGCGVLMISHDLHHVFARTDRVVCLNGHVCCAGRPDHVERDPAYRRLFGLPDLPALAHYTHHHDHAHGGACDHG